MYPTDNYQTIKFWAEDDRPREKLINKGKSALSDSELLAILLGSGTRSKSALELAQEILEKFGNDLFEFSKTNIVELCKFKGIGDAKAVTILAALELGRRRKESEPQKFTIVKASSSVYEFIRPLFQDLTHEECYVLLLNKRNEIRKSIKISQGGFSSTIVDGKMVFKMALDHNASSIIVCHNHPSGQLKPSQMDLTLTRNLVDFGKMIELPVLDHLIYTDNGYFSFADDGIL